MTDRKYALIDKLLNDDKYFRYVTEFLERRAQNKKTLFLAQEIIDLIQPYDQMYRLGKNGLRGDYRKESLGGGALDA